MTILVLGGTGRVGSSAISHLLASGQKVKAIVRNVDKLPKDDNLVGIKQVGDFPVVTAADLEGVTGVISCLGHVMSVSNVLFDKTWVKQSAVQVIETIEASKPSTPIKFIQLNSAGVNNPLGHDQRPFGDKPVLAISSLVRPFVDSRETGRYLASIKSQYVDWCAVRPCNFVEGEQKPYTVTEDIKVSVFSDATIQIGSIGHFISELATKDELWGQWKGKMPFLKDAKDH
ncbi:hypothetical protein BC833DRAFT_583536 [Globomyces pollinis-pini]|nr:hypothetical protein BC833DRAFT_583536 [Globomyces pollinis-pini]